MIFSRDELNKMAEEKYNKLTEKEKEEYLEKNRQMMKKNCLSFLLISCVAFLISFTNFEYILITNVVITLPCIIAAIVGYVSNFVVVDEKRIIITILKRELNVINDTKTKEFEDMRHPHEINYANLVEETSDMIYKVSLLNQRYGNVNLEGIFKLHHYTYYCKSIEEYTNFNFEKWLCEKIVSDMTFFEKIVQVYSKMSEKYSNYIIQYAELENYTPRERMDRKWEYEKYHDMEVKLFKQKKINPIFKPSIVLNVYFVPINGDEYHKNFSCPYEELVEYVESVSERYSKYENYFANSDNSYSEETKTVFTSNFGGTFVKEAKFGKGPIVNTYTRTFYDDDGNLHKIVEQKDLNGNIIKTKHTIEEGKKQNAKENDLNRREDALKKKEEKLNEKERAIKNATNATIRRKQEALEKRENELRKKEYEFFKATKNHIYGADTNQDICEDDMDSWNKLKKLKELYESGEISFEEYDKKRKEYLGD